MRDGVERRLFVAATHQNDGKTTCSLGFVKAFTDCGHRVGFIKPVGQRYVLVGDQRVDEDSLLIQKVCGLDCPLRDMNPIAVGRTFTREYLDDPARLQPKLRQAIHDSYAVAAAGADLAIIEGTGHAGVGAVFDLCNADVARMLDARVVMVTRGGIGRTVDEVTVNRSLFEQRNVPVIGVIVNQVLPDKLDQTRTYLTKAFGRMGLPLLGVIPYRKRLTWPTVQQVVDGTNARVLSGSEHLHNEIAAIIIGAMTPHNALAYLRDRCLLLVPGDRDDVMLAAISTHLLKADIRLVGIVLTGGLSPAPHTMDLLARTNIPVLAVDGPTYDTAARIHGIPAKIQSTDTEKVELATSLIHDFVDVASLWSTLGAA